MSAGVTHVIKYCFFQQGKKLAHNQTDTSAINNAGKKGFLIEIIHPPEDEKQLLFKITIGNEVSSDEPASILRALIEAGERLYGSITTVWIDIVSANIPLWITTSIENCDDFGVSIVVTHDQFCSLDSGGSKIEKSIIAAVKKAADRTSVWHPVKKMVVSFL